MRTLLLMTPILVDIVKARKLKEIRKQIWKRVIEARGFSLAKPENM